MADAGVIVTAAVLELARKRNPTLAKVDQQQSLMIDLGFDSLDLTELATLLAKRLGVDPTREVPLAALPTVADLCALYQEYQTQDRVSG